MGTLQFSHMQLCSTWENESFSPISSVVCCDHGVSNLQSCTNRRHQRTKQRQETKIGTHLSWIMAAQKVKLLGGSFECTLEEKKRMKM